MPTDAQRRSAARLLCVGWDTSEATAGLEEMLRAGVAGVILFARNATTRSGATAVVHAVKSCARGAGNPLLFASIDHEGGRVARLAEGMTVVPSMREVGSRPDSVEHAALIGDLFARELRSCGFDLNFAPVVDVDSNPANPVIGARSFGADPAHVARCACAFIKAQQRGGVAACAKHFPGHGDTDRDSHLDLPRLPHAMDRLRSVELPPFAAAARAGVASMMSAHVVFDAVEAGVPGTLSAKVIGGVLRSEIGFGGVVFSDDMEMAAIADRMPIGEACVRAIEAGIDCLLMCHRLDRQRAAIEALSDAMASGRLAERRVEESLARLDAFARHFVQ
jgi:beta-N-acetylhexosaminidase